MALLGAVTGGVLSKIAKTKLAVKVFKGLAGRSAKLASHIKRDFAKVASKLVKPNLGIYDLKSIKVVDANNEYLKIGYRPPYQGRNVKDFRLRFPRDDFIRAHTDRLIPDGRWMMRRSEVEGLTAAEIQEKFALPFLPKYLSDAHLSAGHPMRLSRTNAIEGWGAGGAWQYESLVDVPIENFLNARRIK